MTSERFGFPLLCFGVISCVYSIVGLNLVGSVEPAALGISTSVFVCIAGACSFLKRKHVLGGIIASGIAVSLSVAFFGLVCHSLVQELKAQSDVTFIIGFFAVLVCLLSGQLITCITTFVYSIIWRWFDRFNNSIATPRLLLAYSQIVIGLVSFTFQVAAIELRVHTWHWMVGTWTGVVFMSAGVLGSLKKTSVRGMGAVSFFSIIMSFWLLGVSTAGLEVDMACADICDQRQVWRIATHGIMMSLGVLEGILSVTSIMQCCCCRGPENGGSGKMVREREESVQRMVILLQRLHTSQLLVLERIIKENSEWRVTDTNPWPNNLSISNEIFAC